MAAFFKAYVPRFKKQHNTPPWACIQEDADPRFYVGPAGEGWAYWLPVENTGYTDFLALEQELGVSLHPDIKTYFNSYWFAHLGGQAGEHLIQSYQAWRNSISRTN